MTLVRFEPFGYSNPWAGISRLQRQMNRMFESATDGEDEVNVINWRPRVNVTELEDRIEVSAELPGMNREDVKVEVNHNILTISGDKKLEHDRKDRNMFLSERVYGNFRRSFQLPSQVDKGKIDAEFKNGVLHIALPKMEEAKPRQIEIKAH